MLNWLATLVYQRYQPKLIVVSGTAGKSMTVALLRQILTDSQSAFWTNPHQNHRLSLPLTFLLEKRFHPITVWVKALSLLIFPWRYPEYLILEFGFERPRLVDYWLRTLEIDYLIITSIGEIPPFAEVFAGPERIQARQRRLLRAVKTDGIVFANGDDYTLFEISEEARQRGVEVHYFGFQPDSQYRAEAVQLTCDLKATPSYCGTTLTLLTPLGRRTVFLRNMFGRGTTYACLAAAALASSIGVELEAVALAIERFQGLPHRLELSRSTHGYYLLDNTVHHSEAAVWEALDVLTKIPGKRKIFVLSDLLTIGKYAFEVHEKIGRVGGKFVDLFVGFGPRAKISVETAIAAGLGRSQTAVFLHRQHHQLAHYLEQTLRPDDVVLVVGDRRLQLASVADYLKR